MTKQTEEPRRNEALIACREARNWNQFIAAQICRVNLSTYKGWESGRYRPSVPHLRRLVEVFEVKTPEELGYALTEKEREEWGMQEVLGTLKKVPPRPLPEWAIVLQQEIDAKATERRPAS